MTSSIPAKATPPKRNLENSASSQGYMSVDPDPGRIVRIQTQIALLQRELARQGHVDLPDDVFEIDKA